VLWFSTKTPRGNADPRLLVDTLERRTHDLTMTAARLVRAGAVLGVIGGVVRAAGSFAPMLIASDDVRTWLYVAIDACLAAGLLSIYVPRRHHMRAGGTVGFFLAVGGLIAVRTSPAMTHVDLYPVGAAGVATGVMTLAFSEWRAMRLAAWIPVTFALSLALGSIGTFTSWAGTLFIVSGILFGSAFAAMAITAS
jgi:hypothetical protein